MPSPSDLALRVLRLEQQLESYQRLHSDELAEMRRVLDELSREVLALVASRPAVTPSGCEAGSRAAPGLTDARPQQE